MFEVEVVALFASLFVAEHDATLVVAELARGDGCIPSDLDGLSGGPDGVCGRLCEGSVMVAISEPGSRGLSSCLGHLRR